MADLPSINKPLQPDFRFACRPAAVSSVVARHLAIERPTRGLAVDRRQLPVIPCLQSDSENFVINQKLTQYPAWRLWPVHAVAKLMGLVVKVDGLPFGLDLVRQGGAAEAGGATGSSSAGCKSPLDS